MGEETKDEAPCLSAPYTYLNKGTVGKPRLHKAKMVKYYDDTWGLGPICGTKIDWTCLEHAYDTDSFSTSEWCKRCFSKELKS